MALSALDKSDEKAAIRLFRESSSKSNKKIARLSAENLTKLGNVTDRNKAADLLVKKYGDDESLKIACEVFFEQGEYSRVIAITEKINLQTAPNQLVYYRIKSLDKKNDRRYDKEFYEWFISRPLSSYHSELYGEYSKKQEEKFYEENGMSDGIDSELLSPRDRILNYRILLYKKNYISAFEETDSILSIYNEEKKLPDYQLISDMGKAALYGNDDFKVNAQKFERLASRVSADGELSYCAYFYAARLYDKAGRYQEKTVQRFKSALDSTADKERFDNALWYLLNMQLRMSTDDICATLKKYASKINNSSYFDDFFDNFSVLLLSHEKWQDFYDMWKLIDGYASEEASCKYAYISGRILEEGYGNANGQPKTKEAVNAYSRVLSGNSSMYYKVCALERLNIVDKTYVTDVLCSGGPELERQIDNDAQILLSGYAAFGFPQKIYSQWLSDRKNLSMDCNIQVCRFLNQCGIFDNVYSVQSLRVAERTKTIWSGKLPFELLELCYPRFYSAFVKEACIENNISEPLLYALIRSESFFDAEISSKAGANGLTQLMRATADEEARKLNLPADYNILDPLTNIRMGSHYFAGLVERSEKKSELLALFAYNAGLTNVRRWKRPAGMSMDLYLETIPFQETREYGRKLVSAAAMYGFLYYNTTPAETVRRLMAF